MFTKKRLLKMQLGNGRWETAEYDQKRQQITKIGLGVTSNDQDLLKLEFKYTTGETSSDNNGSLREQKITVPTVGSNSGFTAIQTYTYDSLNRIQSATETVSGTQTSKQTFSIDRYGNRRFDTSNNNTTTLQGCDTSVCNPEINTSDNRLKKDQVGGSSVDYDYDANGSLTKDFDGQRFGYDAESHQKEYFSASNQTTTPDATYNYDGAGRRVKKVVGTEVTIFVYDTSGLLAAEYSTTVAPEARAEVSYLTTDHLGSPRVITDRNGAVMSRKDFTAFGEALTSPQRKDGVDGNGYDSPNIRQDYTGYQKDTESGLEFAQARYYSAGHGSFTSVDPLAASATIRNPQTFNRYSYALNSPYKFSDPLGLMSQGSYSESGFCGAESNTCSNDNFDPFSADKELQARQNVVLGGVLATSLGSDGKPKQITTKDRKALQKNLRKLIPGAKVLKNGQVSVPSGTSDSAASRLINGIASTGRTVTIVVNHSRNNSTDAPTAATTFGQASDVVVNWDPDYVTNMQVRVDANLIKSEPRDPVLGLVHELIHAYNYMRPYQNAYQYYKDGLYGGGFTHYFTEKGVAYAETAHYEELRTLGYFGNLADDVTENQIRAQLGYRSRATYTDRQYWTKVSIK